MALGVEGVRVGLFTDPVNYTGCTVVLPPPGSVGGMMVRGGAPGTRESSILGPQSGIAECHGVILCGSSLFGLRAADGVVDWCESHGIGLRLPVGVFPIIGAAVVLDIHGDMQRLTSAAGHAACEAASEDEPENGSVGVGTGCTVGKEAGLAWGSKGGQGSAVETAGALTVGAIVAVNALGSVYGQDGRIIAGCRAPADAPRFPQVNWHDLNAPAEAHDGSLANTIIGCIVTNARLGKPDACRVADLAHTGIARCVRPAHTNLDGDALFTLATQSVPASLDLVADLAARAVERAIQVGVREAAAMPGWPVDPRVR